MKVFTCITRNHESYRIIYVVLYILHCLQIFQTLGLLAFSCLVRGVQIENMCISCTVCSTNAVKLSQYVMESPQWVEQIPAFVSVYKVEEFALYQVYATCAVFSQLTQQFLVNYAGACSFIYLFGIFVSPALKIYKSYGHSQRCWWEETFLLSGG